MDAPTLSPISQIKNFQIERGMNINAPSKECGHKIKDKKCHTTHVPPDLDL